MLTLRWIEFVSRILWCRGFLVSCSFLPRWVSIGLSVFFSSAQFDMKILLTTSEAYFVFRLWCPIESEAMLGINTTSDIFWFPNVIYTIFIKEYTFEYTQNKLEKFRDNLNGEPFIICICTVQILGVKYDIQCVLVVKYSIHIHMCLIKFFWVWVWRTNFL